MALCGFIAMERDSGSCAGCVRPSPKRVKLSPVGAPGCPRVVPPAGRTGYARIPRITSPCTSVNRMSRPPKRYVRRL